MYTKYEQETVINTNQEDKTASIYTCEPPMIRKMDKLALSDPRIQLVGESDGCKTYEIPKAGVKIRLPRILSSAKRAELSKRAKANFHS